MAVKRNSPLTSVKGVIEAARKGPNELTYASSGIGSAHQITGELLNRLAGIRITHVPYQGGGPAVQALMKGEVSMSYGSLPTLLTLEERGELKIIAMAETKRSASYPNIPTIAETVPGVTSISWIGLLAPASTPPAILERLNKIIIAGMSDPAMKEKLLGIGVAPVFSSLRDFDNRMRDEFETWRRIIPPLGIAMH